MVVFQFAQYMDDNIECSTCEWHVATASSAKYRTLILKLNKTRYIIGMTGAA